MAKLLSIGTWAYAFGPYQDNPVPFDTVVKKLGELGYDGVEIGAFKPHIHPEDYPMASDRQNVRNLVKSCGLRVSGLAADFWGDKGTATDAAQKDDYYLKLFKKNLQLALDLGGSEYPGRHREPSRWRSGSGPRHGLEADRGPLASLRRSRRRGRGQGRLGVRAGVPLQQAIGSRCARR
jgi:sugar phosphate isomerase/epimerase